MPRRPGDRRWLQMGVELEGGWDKSYRDVATTATGAAGKTDGSVIGLAGHMGEITTRPHSILDHLCTDVTKLYPNYVNGSCGFHIHTSFSPLDTSALADKPFWDYYRARWKAFGERHEADMGRDVKELFWSRWHGKKPAGADRSYCSAEFKPLEQLSNHNDRYTQLNFVAYHKYKTVESRLLPMFSKPELACLAIREMSDIYDTYLNAVDFPSISMERVFADQDGALVEEINLTMPAREYWEENFSEKPHKRVEVGDDVFYHAAGAEMLMFPWNTDAGPSDP